MPRTEPSAEPTPRQRWAENDRRLAHDLGASRRGPEGMARSMAAVMVSVTAAQGQVTEADLCAAGFTAEDIARYGAAAKREAARSAPQLRGNGIAA
jgi:hypothetical protein